MKKRARDQAKLEAGWAATEREMTRRYGTGALGN
jgi:hypothetical protein